ncbi:MAG: radical SAM protein, partial [Vicinamibacteria bacterium]
LLIRASELTHRTFVLPLLIFYPTSRCNSRCTSCDWWKATGEDDLTLGEIRELSRSLPGLGTRTVAFSGGEPLLRPDFFDVADLFALESMKLELLTSGVLLQRHAKEVARRFTRVTVSLDATERDRYRRVRGIDALSTVEAGIASLRGEAPTLGITARATLHKENFRELSALVRKARELGLQGISFLAADVSSTAFGRREAPSLEAILLEGDEIEELRAVIEEAIASEREAFESGFVAERPEKLRRIPEYYAALRGEAPFPPVACNAPWVSAVVEANGAVRPCFFHEPVGNVRERPLAELLRRELPDFRRALDVATNSLCERCVCSIRMRRAS